MIFTLYIIYSQKLDRYYTGHTSDIDMRITQHNSGISDFTSVTNDWKVVYSETYATREEARKREAAIKKKKSRKYIEWLVSSAG
ncbi:MAG: hypothetical protein BGO69_13690 [Bacteroidetes bacterium 46-16]|nr:MAG: hypothetical protein BGO69_13690 [Bacteroidetes bacterium 46-16]